MVSKIVTYEYERLGTYRAHVSHNRKLQCWTRARPVRTEAFIFKCTLYGASSFLMASGSSALFAVAFVYCLEVVGGKWIVIVGTSSSFLIPDIS